MNFNTSFSSTKVVFDAKVRTDDSSANKRLFILRDANGQFLEGLTFDTSGKIVASDGRSLGKFMRDVYKRQVIGGPRLNIDATMLSSFVRLKYACEVYSNPWLLWSCNLSAAFSFAIGA